jgi:hypothetical protein
MEVLTPADNRPQTTVHGPQLTQVNYKLYFLSVLVDKRILGKISLDEFWALISNCEMEICTP